MKHALANQRITHCLNNYGIKVAKLTFLPVGADWYASGYEAETRDPSSYFIKLKHGHQHGYEC